MIGPLLGAHLFLRGVEVKPGAVITPEVRDAALAGIDTAYFWICGLIAALALFFFASRRLLAAVRPAETVAARGIAPMLREALRSRWALLGGAAIFLYVGAEVAIGTQMAFFLNSDAIWGRSDALFAVPLIDQVVARDGVVGLSLEQAGKAVALYWGGAMVGRAIGSVLLARFPAARLLAAATAVAAAMCLYVALVGGVAAGFVAIAIGLFNAIMFPVIFTLTLERSTAGDEATSGLLCTAIVGGAFIPLLVGAVSGALGYAMALIVPAMCYVALLAFAVAAGRTGGRA